MVAITFCSILPVLFFDNSVRRLALCGPVAFAHVCLYCCQSAVRCFSLLYHLTCLRRVPFAVGGCGKSCDACRVVNVLEII